MWPKWRETIPLWTEAIDAKYRGKEKPYGREEFDKLFGDYDVSVETFFSFPRLPLIIRSSNARMPCSSQRSSWKRTPRPRPS